MVQLLTVKFQAQLVHNKNPVLNYRRQRGSVMIEAAYVLPLLIMLFTAIFEGYSYSVTGIAVSNTISSYQQAALEEASYISGDPSVATNYVSCSSNVVDIEDAFKNELISDITSAYGFTPAVSVSSASLNSTFTSYTVTVTGEIPASVLSGLGVTLNLDIQSVFALRSSC